jgi:hypothetical protein
MVIGKHHVQLAFGALLLLVGISCHATSATLVWGNFANNIQVIALVLLSVTLLSLGFRLLLISLQAILFVRRHDASKKHDDHQETVHSRMMAVRGMQYWFDALILEPCSLSQTSRSTPSTAVDQRWMIATSLLLTIASGLVLTTYSTGHGRQISQTYHQIVIVGMFALLFGILLSVHLARRYQVLTVRRLLGAMVLLAIAVSCSEMVAFHGWPQGFDQHARQHLVYEWPGCSLPRCLAHRYIFPRRFFNFFMGSESCPATADSWLTTAIPALDPGSGNAFARLHNGLLTMQCPKPTQRAEYMVRPDFFATLSIEQLESLGPWVYRKARRGSSLNSTDTGDANEHFDIAHRVALQLANNTERQQYTGPVRIDDEWVRAFCGEYEMMPIQVRERPHIVQQQQVYKRRHSSESNDLASLEESAVGLQAQPPDILLLMIDSVSRAEFHHSMPLTSAMLGQLHDSNLAAVSEFFRFHSVARHTLPNLAALLSGLHEAEQEQRSFFGSDPHGFIWNLYREQMHYVTGYMLDMCADYFADFRIVDADVRQAIGIDHEFVLPFCHPHYLDHSLDSPFNGPYSIRYICWCWC